MDLFDAVFGSNTPVVGSKTVVRINDVPTTVISPLKSYSKVIGSKSSNNNILYKVKNINNISLENMVYSYYSYYRAIDEMLQNLTYHNVTDNADGSKIISVHATESGFVESFLDYYDQYGEIPGDAWDGVSKNTADTIKTMFGAALANEIPTRDVLRAAEYERNRGVRASTLALMYENNVNQYVWFADDAGQWHCYKKKGDL